MKKTERKIYTQALTSATAYLIDSVDIGDGLIALPGEEILVQHVAAGEVTSPSVAVTGYVVKSVVASPLKSSPISGQ